MKAFIIKAGSTTLDGLELVEKEKPSAGSGEILVEMKAASLNFRDLIIPLGVYIGGPVARDTIPLSDGAGEVVAVGEGVTRFQTGDRVASTFFRNYVDRQPEFLPAHSIGSPHDGNLAEYAVFNENDAVKIPDNLSYVEAATLPCAGVTAWNALMVAGKAIKEDDTVLTLGTGGVSMMALQLAKAIGANVISTSSSDEKLAKAKALGADHGINYKSFPEWQEQVKAVTEGHGADCGVEVGGAGTLSRSIQSIGVGGKICMIGVLSGQEGNTDPRGLMMTGGSIHGIFVGSRTMFENLNKFIEINDIHPVIDKVFSFEEAPEAYTYMQSQAHMGKVVIAIQ